jgi:hypothetical protein
MFNLNYTIMKKLIALLTVYTITAIVGIALACSGHIYVSDIEQARINFQNNCSVGDVLTVTDVTTGITHTFRGVQQQ